MNHDKPVAQPPVEAGSAALTIGDLAERTGVSTSVLRMWEARHGFPEPRRLSSGHRRYAEADVDLVKQVVRRKDSGIRLEVAIAEVASRNAPANPSVFAELRRLHPALPAHRLRKSTLIALSWAIEDECCATADRPVLFGAFQRGDLYAPSAARWADLARTARSAIVFADHWDGEAADASGPIRVSLDENAPMRREWAVICDAPDSAACLTAWELPGQSALPDRHRMFEATWTIDPVEVRNSARIAAKVAADAGVLAAQQLEYELAEPPTSRATTTASATALFNRVIAYVDRLS